MGPAEMMARQPSPYRNRLVTVIARVRPNSPKKPNPDRGKKFLQIFCARAVVMDGQHPRIIF